MSISSVSAGKVDDYASHLFRVLDTDKDQLISFSEVLIGFHHLTLNGDEREKLKIVFDMYDVDGDKKLTPHNVKM